MTHHINPAAEPISDDDATIAAALEEASIPCLMMSMIHMSGDASLLGETYEDEPRFVSPGAPRAAWVGVELGF